MKIIVNLIIIGFSLSLPVFASEGIERFPLSNSFSYTSDHLFQRLTPQQTGITHTNPIDDDHPFARVYHTNSAGGGIAIGDINLDGKLDFFASGGAVENSLYLGIQQGMGLQFRNVAREAGVEGDFLDWAVGAAMIDIDDDGDLDIYVCNYDRPNQLFLNRLIAKGKRGPFGFDEVAREWGLDLKDGCVMPAFADYDRDGDLDVYVLTQQIYREEGRPSEPIGLVMREGKRYVSDDWARYFKLKDPHHEKGRFEYTESGRPDFLLRNDEGTFTNVSFPAGINRDGHWGSSATWLDFNHDGWPDLYVGNDFGSPDLMYRNNGNGTFKEVSKKQLRHSSWFTKGAAQTDLNNDGLIDFVTADMLPSTHYLKQTSMGLMDVRKKELPFVDGVRQFMRNAVHLNTGTDHFLEGSWMTGMAATGWTRTVRSHDFNNDGTMDVFFTNGVPRHFYHSDLPSLSHGDLIGRSHWSHYKNAPVRRERNQVFRNDGDLNFTEVGQEWGLDHNGLSYGASTADFDGDGRLELLVANLSEPISFYHNRATDGNRVVFEFKGKRSNRNGIGVSIEISAGGKKMIRQLFPSGGYLDGDDSIVHFGLGNSPSIQSTRIIWPSGHEQSFTSLMANHRYVITEPDKTTIRSRPVKSRQPASPMFSESNALKDARHREFEYDDFLRQPLLPFKLSQLGPGQAWGDVDGDGDPDLYLGGAGGQSGQLLINLTPAGSKKPQFKKQKVAAFIKDARHEDMGCLFFDADADGDADLYVASGGVESVPGGGTLRDRLYLNDGTGSFEEASRESLPPVRESSGTVSAADFDRDGDLDLFVGSRSVPGQYPVSPKSTLLRNDGGTFSTVTDEVAPELSEIGMVTSSLWSDVDADGWADLLVTLDWGTVKLFKNKSGKLTQSSDVDTGFEKLTGWYNGIAGGDIDADGDIDFVVTNLGTNTPYQASPEMPRMLFYGNFEGTDRFNIVECMSERIGNREPVTLPHRGFSSSAKAIPSVGRRFKSFEAYAGASLTEIFDINQLQGSLSLTATNFRNLVMINDGTGSFTTSPLPHLTEVSPGFGVTLNDVDLDGYLDCYIVQNFFTGKPQTAEFDSGLSLLLRGTGNPARPFVPVSPEESGLFVPGDAKSVSSVDVNADGKVDLMIGQNNDRPILYLNKIKPTDSHSLEIHLKGKAGNPDCIGAKVSVLGPGLYSKTIEVYAGGGYLTQNMPRLYFGIPNSFDRKEIVVRVVWPDGETSEIQAMGKSRLLVLSH